MNASRRHSLSLSALMGSRPLWQVRVALLVVSALVVLLLQALLPGAFRAVEEQVGSLAWQMHPSTQPESRFSVIAIDEKSVQEVGRWPWPRETMAKLSDKLALAGVQLQLYDIYFPEASDGDDVLAAALQRNSAILPQVPELRASGESVHSGQLDHPVGGIDCAQTVQTANFVGNAPAFAGVAKGHIAPWVDADGAIRKVPATVCVDGQNYPLLAISALLKATDAKTWRLTMKSGQRLFGAARELTLDSYPGLALPLDAAGNLRVSYENRPEVYRAISAADVLADRVDPALLANSWVLVGFTASGLIDIVPTPFNGAAAGVELQARIIGSILDDKVPYTPRSAPVLLSLLALAFGLALVGVAGAREKAAGYGLTAGVVLLPLLAFAFHAALLESFHLWLGWLLPAVFGSLAAGALLLLEFARVKLERGRVLDNLSSYLPADVAAEIAYSLPSSSINAQRRNVTLLSADLRNFSAYGESRPPEESAALLHYFFTRTTSLIEKFNGRVHEFKGDSLLAIWDGSDSDAAASALAAAQAMQQIMVEVLPQHPPAGLEPLALGIGIEQGPVLIGSIGPAHRRTHTLLGETVTITLRIQEMTADLAQPILVGECAARQLAEQGLVSQGSYLLNGLRNPHILYAPPLRDMAQSSVRTDAPPLRLLRGGRP